MLARWGEVDRHTRDDRIRLIGYTLNTDGLEPGDAMFCTRYIYTVDLLRSPLVHSHISYRFLTFSMLIITETLISALIPHSDSKNNDLDCSLDRGATIYKIVEVILI